MLRHFFECALEEGFTCLRRALFGVVRSLTYGSPKMHTEPGGKVRRWSVGHDAPCFVPWDGMKTHLETSAPEQFGARQFGSTCQKGKPRRSGARTHPGRKSR